MTDRIELNKASIQKLGDDVLLTQYKTGNRISIKDAKEIDNTHLTMSQGNDMFVIADLTANDLNFDKNAEEYFVKKGKMIPYTKGIAIVTNQKRSFFKQLFSMTKKTLYPTKEFSTMNHAMEWLDKQRD